MFARTACIYPAFIAIAFSLLKAVVREKYKDKKNPAFWKKAKTETGKKWDELSLIRAHINQRYKVVITTQEYFLSKWHCRQIDLSKVLESCWVPERQTCGGGGIEQEMDRKWITEFMVIGLHRELLRLRILYLYSGGLSLPAICNWWATDM